MIVVLALMVVLLASHADAVEFRAAAHGSINPGTSCSANVPSGTQNGDLLLAVAVANQSSDATISAPSGWTQIATQHIVADSTIRVSLFYKAASNESGSYGFTSSESVRFSCTVTAWYDGIHPTNPIAQYTSTSYVVSNTTLRAAGLTTTAPASLIFAGAVHCNPECPITPPTSPAAFTEHVDYFDNRHQRYFAALNWTSSGATDNVDATISTAPNTKHAFLLELSTSSSPATSILRRRLP